MKKYYSKHPCYNETCISNAKIMHIPIALKCNIKCEYCNMQVSSCTLNFPGISSVVVKPENVLKYINSKDPSVNVIGIAGPGDALFNDETYEALKILKKETKYPTCICTNGLLLEDKLDQLIDLDLDFLSVTINALDYDVAEKIYSSAFYNDVHYNNRDASKLIVDKQQKGLLIASQKKNFLMKVNTVYVPGVNDDQIVKIAKMCKEYNIDIMNIIPVIPTGIFKDIKIDESKLESLRIGAEKYVKQKCTCNRCRADAYGYIK